MIAQVVVNPTTIRSRSRRPCFDLDKLLDCYMCISLQEFLFNRFKTKMSIDVFFLIPGWKTLCRRTFKVNKLWRHEYGWCQQMIKVLPEWWKLDIYSTQMSRLKKMNRYIFYSVESFKKAYSIVAIVTCIILLLHSYVVSIVYFILLNQVLHLFTFLFIQYMGCLKKNDPKVWHMWSKLK